MNLKALYDLKERLEYSAIAGTGLLKEDFRLKRTVDNLAPLASASPVFAKISASAGKLLEASEKELSKQLLDVLSLVDAVIYTQGKKIVPLLKDGFEPCGKKDMVRRAMLIRELAGVDENDWYIKILPETQKEILEIIIKALGEDSNNEKLILELYNTEKGKAKEAVLYALAKINSQDGKYTPLELSHLIDFQNVLVGKYSAQVYDLWIWIAEQMSKFNN